MNVQMRFITSDNVDQLTSLTKTDNIKLITGEDDLEGVESKIMETLKQSDANYGEMLENITDVATETPEPSIDDFSNIPSPEAEWAPDSPKFYPPSAKATESPGYGSHTPDYDPYSPGKKPNLSASYKFEPTDRYLREGDKVTFQDAVQHGYTSDTPFTIIWVDHDSVDASIEAPDGVRFIAYHGELGDVPPSDSFTNNTNSPAYNPNTPSPTITSSTAQPQTTQGSAILKTVTDPQTAQVQQQQQLQPTIVYDANNPAVTVTETKTVTGPQFVLPPQPMIEENIQKVDVKMKQAKILFLKNQIRL